MKQITQRSFRSTMFVLAGICLLGSFCLRNVMADDKPFNDRSLRGAYGYSGHGTHFGLPTGFFGRVNFSGDGTCSLLHTGNLQGTGAVGPLEAVSCIYSVSPNGTGTMAVLLPVLGPFSLAFVIVDEKHELRLITLSSDVIVNVVAKKQ